MPYSYVPQRNITLYVGFADPETLIGEYALIYGVNAKALTVRTAEYGGRLRKYYRITKVGLKRLEEFKKEWKEVMSIYQFVANQE